MFKRILLCHDGSEAGRRALRRGAELAILVKAQVAVLSIMPRGYSDANLIAQSVGSVCLVDQKLEYERSVEDSVRWLRARGVEADGFLATGNTIDAIAAHSVRLNIDLIVVGHYPESTGGRWWSGPERDALAERVKCCVLIAMSD
jgi:nucleotide-binding universal stress UspA family protein